MDDGEKRHGGSAVIDRRYRLGSGANALRRGALQPGKSFAATGATEKVCLRPRQGEVASRRTRFCETNPMFLDAFMALRCLNINGLLVW